MRNLIELFLQKFIVMIDHALYHNYIGQSERERDTSMQKDRDMNKLR